MFKLTVLYPKSDGSTFDMDYYRDEARRARQPRARAGAGRDRPGGRTVRTWPSATSTTPSQEALQAALGGPDVGEAMADVPNYTNVEPQIQISEILE